MYFSKHTDKFLYTLFEKGSVVFITDSESILRAYPFSAKTHKGTHYSTYWKLHGFYVRYRNAI